MIRRNDKLPLLLMLMFAATGVWLLTAAKIGMIMVFLPAVASVAVIAYLGGPAAFVAVTQTHVVVGNPLVEYTVPRSLVDGVQGYARLNIELHVSGHAPIELRALIPGLAAPQSLSAARYEKRFRAILDLMNQTPAAPTTGTIERRYRLVHVLLLVTCVGTFVTALILVLAHPNLAP